MRNLRLHCIALVGLLVVLLAAHLAAQTAAPASIALPVTTPTTAPVTTPTTAPVAAEVAVDVGSEPSHHFIAQNEYARWFRVEVAPQTTTLVHRHELDYFYVVLGDAEVENHVAGGNTATLKFYDSEVRFKAGGFAHSARDLSATPFRNVTIELKQKGSASAAADTALHEIAPGVTRRVVMVQDGVRVTELQLAAGAAIPMHHHDAPHLVVALTEMELTSISATGTVIVRQKPGDTAWIKAGVTHSLQNSGQKVAKFLTLEWQ